MSLRAQRSNPVEISGTPTRLLRCARNDNSFDHILEYKKLLDTIMPAGLNTLKANFVQFLINKETDVIPRNDPDWEFG